MNELKGDKLTVVNTEDIYTLIGNEDEIICRNSSI
jgi:hypothetical protein